MNKRWQPFVAFAVITLSACNGGRDLDDLNKGQKDILARLDALDKLAQQLKTAPAPAAAGRAPQPDPGRVASLPLGDAPVRGPRSAKVTIAECSDFQCPFCGQATGVVDQVLKAYPKDVNFAYKQFPLPPTMHPDAMAAAKAAVAAEKQGKFWEMHDTLFQNQRDLGSDKLKEYAKKIGVDVAKWEKDYNSPETQAQVEKEMAECQAAGVTGTPTFFVNGKRVLNRSFDGFKDMIDASLKDQSGGKKG